MYQAQSTTSIVGEQFGEWKGIQIKGTAHKSSFTTELNGLIYAEYMTNSNTHQTDLWTDSKAAMNEYKRIHTQTLKMHDNSDLINCLPIASTLNIKKVKSQAEKQQEMRPSGHLKKKAT
jgi:hypothetical protein